MIRVAVLVSGRGSNMNCLVDAIETYGIAAKITVVISNKDCAGIALAQDRGLQTQILKSNGFDRPADHDLAVAATINDYDNDYVFLAGYMKILGNDFVDQFSGRLINIHPSLLPAFKGLGTHQRAIDGKVTTHGASVHLVTATLDDGLIAQASLPILELIRPTVWQSGYLTRTPDLPIRFIRLAEKSFPYRPAGRWHAPSSALAHAPAHERSPHSCLIWPA